MRAKQIYISKFRSFKEHALAELTRINVFIGANNAGKSSILRAMHLLQQGSEAGTADINSARGLPTSYIAIKLEEDPPSKHLPPGGTGEFVATINQNGVEKLMKTNHNPGGIPFEIPNIEPKHLIIPFFSKRKTGGYTEDTRSQYAKQVSPYLSNLPAKVSRISNATHPAYGRYTDACREIIGFPVCCAPSENGQQAGIYVDEDISIPITQMGDGVPHIVGLLTELCVAKNKIFLIEEPENDLHPQALKALLDIIVESSSTNQFLISTHSHIVVRHLAGLDRSKIFKVEGIPQSWPPESKIAEVEDSPEARLSILNDLGYSLSDFHLWEGWIILEESSAERIIRDYIIPLFAPKLSRVRLIASGGISNVESNFQEFDRMVRFTHLEPVYKGKAWVRIDGDEEGKKIISKLQSTYSSWNPWHFGTFTESCFEKYYPKEFSKKAEIVLTIADKKERREAKRELLLEVIDWLDENKARAESALKESASEIIKDLQKIEQRLFSHV